MKFKLGKKALAISLAMKSEVTVTYLPSPLIPLAPRARHCNRSLSNGSFAV